MHVILSQYLNLQPFISDTTSPTSAREADLGRFLVQDDSSHVCTEVVDGIGELPPLQPAVITLAMEPRDDDHYLSAVNHDEDVDKDNMMVSFSMAPEPPESLR